MKSNSRRALQITLASVFLLMSCDVATFMSPQQIPTLVPAAIDLIAAQTAAAAATETAALTPPTLMPTLTPFPTQTPVSTPTITPTFIFLLFTPTDTITPTVTICDDAIYVSDVTIKDGTVESPGQSFVKTWALQNTGSCTWNTGYTLNFVGGTQMGGTNTNIDGSVVPGELMQISVTLTAPTTAGKYTGKWRLNNDSGEFFGETVAVVINVDENATATPTAIITAPTNTSPAPTSVPTTAIPTSVPTTAVPTSVPTTVVPTSVPTTAVPATPTP
jgi:Ig-like domain from next to BRCA1 gene